MLLESYPFARTQGCYCHQVCANRSLVGQTLWFRAEFATGAFAPLLSPRGSPKVSLDGDGDCQWFGETAIVGGGTVRGLFSYTPLLGVGFPCTFFKTITCDYPPPFPGQYLLNCDKLLTGQFDCRDPFDFDANLTLPADLRFPGGSTCIGKVFFSWRRTS